MNIVLFSREQRMNDRVYFEGKQADHIHKVLKAKPGDLINVGEIDGMMGSARILEIGNRVSCQVDLKMPPPPPLPLTVLLALPRPKALKRLLQTLASLGIKSIFLFGCWKVEKSYWSSPVLFQQNLKKYLLLGLEQSKDTVLPHIELMPLFKPFVEDRVPELIKNNLALLAHPKSIDNFPRSINAPVVLAIGPEGGFIPYEIEKFTNVGFQSVSLGPRVLKSEVVIPYLAGRLWQK
jgi:RsmE family RNA methyltransferase